MESYTEKDLGKRFAMEVACKKARMILESEFAFGDVESLERTHIFPEKRKMVALAESPLEIEYEYNMKSLITGNDTHQISVYEYEKGYFAIVKTIAIEPSYSIVCEKLQILDVCHHLNLI